MRKETTVVSCDADGCTETLTSSRTGWHVFVGVDWVSTGSGDYCPQHAPGEYECGPCRAVFPTIRAFDEHRKTCGRRR